MPQQTRHRPGAACQRDAGPSRRPPTDKPRRRAVGYIKADKARSNTDVQSWEGELRSKADDENLDLVAIHVEYDTSRKPRLEAIFTAVRSYDRPDNKIQVLLTPIKDDLGFDPKSRQEIEDRFNAFDVQVLPIVQDE
jgi:hypothetical protein